jgi:uncharacterized protein
VPHRALSAGDRRSPVPLKLSRYLTTTPPFIDPCDGREKRVVFGTRRSRTFILDEVHWQQLGAQTFGELPEDLLDRLGSAQILVPVEEDELRTVLTENRLGIVENEVLYSVIQPSAFCQLGCHYCGQKHSLGSLDEGHLGRVVDRLRCKLERRRYRRLLICWFGGEPLLGLPILRALTPRLQHLAREFDCEFSANIATNGLGLTPAVATELAEKLGVRYAEVCIDGLQEQHDSRRPKKSGHGSFAAIFRNVAALAARGDLDLKLTIRCNVDRHNYQDVIPLMDLLVAAGVHHRLARFYVAPIHAWGNDADQSSLSAKEFACLEVDWLAGMIRRGFPFTLLPERREIVCMAVQPDAEVIDAAGNIFHCTEVSQVPAYEREDSFFGNVYAEGNLASSGIPLRPSPLRVFNHLIAQQQVPCSQCEVLPVCGGKCPKLWLEGKIPCPSIKHNLPERLTLAQLLGAHGIIPPLESVQGGRNAKR